MPSVLWSQALPNDVDMHEPDIEAHRSNWPIPELLTVCVLTLTAQTSAWYIDSGASAHVCKDRHEFITNHLSADFDHVVLGDNTHLSVKGEGQVRIPLSGNEWLTISGVLHVPTMSKNLLSVRQLTKQSEVILSFRDTICDILIKGKIKAQGKLGEDLYTLVPGTNVQMHLTTLIHKPNLWHARLGHPNKQKMQLMSSGRFYRDEFMHDFDQLQFCKVCVRAKQTKTPYPTGGGQRATGILQLLHAYLCGPVSVKSLGGGRYFLTIVDEYSRYAWVYVLKKKSEVFELFKDFQALVERQSGLKLHALRTDNGGEFDSVEFNEYCQRQGILRELTTPYSSAHNGVAERMNRTLQDITRSLIKQANLPMSYWGEAVAMAAYLHSRLPGKSVSSTPFELWHCRKPSLGHIGIFGSAAYAHQNQQQVKHSKLSDRSRKYIFVGFTDGIKAYKLYDPVTHQVAYSRSVIFDEQLKAKLPSDTMTYGGKIEEATEGDMSDEDGHSSITINNSTATQQQSGSDLERDHTSKVTNANVTPDPAGAASDVYVPSNEEVDADTLQPAEGDSPMSVAVPHQTNNPSTSTSHSLRPRDSIKPPDIYSPSKWQSSTSHTDWSTGVVADDEGISHEGSASASDVAPRTHLLLHEPPQHPFMYTEPFTKQQVFALAAAAELTADPVTMTEALSSREAHHWKRAVDEEYASLLKNNTWTLAPLPPGRNMISNKWLFKKKYTQDGTISKYKARLVARGFSQRYGEDYIETFAPVVKFPTLRLVLALAASENLDLQQMDVKSVYLNRIITEDTYMSQPEGYVMKGREDMACKLNKSIYGLKQSGRKWYQRLDASLLKMGFTKSAADQNLYILRHGHSYLLLLMYVDDILLASNSVELLTKVKSQLNNEFEMSDMGQPAYMLGVQIRRDRERGTISISQDKYISNILKRFGMMDAHPSRIPLTAGVKLEKAPAIDMLRPKEKADVAAIPYKQAVGSLIFLSCLTRPDLAFPVHLVS